MSLLARVCECVACDCLEWSIESSRRSSEWSSSFRPSSRPMRETSSNDSYDKTQRNDWDLRRLEDSRRSKHTHSSMVPFHSFHFLLPSILPVKHWQTRSFAKTRAFHLVCSVPDPWKRSGVAGFHKDSENWPLEEVGRCSVPQGSSWKLASGCGLVLIRFSSQSSEFPEKSTPGRKNLKSGEYFKWLYADSRCSSFFDDWNIKQLYLQKWDMVIWVWAEPHRKPAL